MDVQAGGAGCQLSQCSGAAAAGAKLLWVPQQRRTRSREWDSTAGVQGSREGRDVCLEAW